MNIIEKITTKIHQHEKEWYYKPHFIVLNYYTKHELERQIHQEDLLKEWSELGNKYEFRGIPVLIKPDHSDEVYIETILDYKRIR